MKDQWLRKMVGYQKDAPYYTIDRRLQYLENVLEELLKELGYAVNRKARACGCCDEIALEKAPKVKKSGEGKSG